MYNYYVNYQASGDESGNDWYNAFTTISGALEIIDSVPASSGVNIYVALGDYYMDLIKEQNEFNIYGGYVIPTTVSSGEIATNYDRYFSRIVSKENHLNSGTFQFDGIEFKSYGSQYIIYNTTTLKFHNCEFFVENGIESDGSENSTISSGILYLNNIKAIGIDSTSGYFIHYGIVQDTNSIYSNYRIPLFLHSEPYIDNDIFHHCNIGVSMSAQTLLNPK